MQNRILALISGIGLSLLVAGCGSSIGVESGGSDVVGVWTIDVERSAALEGTELNRQMSKIRDRKVRNEAVLKIESNPVVEFFEDGRFKFSGNSNKLEGTWRYIRRELTYELQSPNQKQPLRLCYRDKRLHNLNETDNPTAIVFRRFNEGSATKEPAAGSAGLAPSTVASGTPSKRPDAPARITAPSAIDALHKLDDLGPLTPPELSRAAVPSSTLLYGTSLSADGRRAIVVGSGASGGVAHLIDPVTGALLHRDVFASPKPYRGVQLSPDGKRALLWDDKGFVQLVDVEARRELFQLPHQKKVNCAAFSSDGLLVATGEGGDKGVAYVWDTASGILRKSFDYHHTSHRGIIGVHFDSRQQGLHVCDGLDLVTLEIATGEMRSRFPVGAGAGWEFASFTPDGRRVAVGYAQNAAVWDMLQGKQIAAFKVCNSLVSDLYLSANGAWLAAGEKNGEFGLWEVATGSPIARYDSKKGSSGFSLPADERSILVGGSSYLRAWASPDNLPQTTAADPPAAFKVGEILRFQPAPDRHLFDDLEILADGKRAVVSSNKKLFIYDLGDGRSIGVEQLRGHTEAARTLGASSDGRIIASGSADKTIRIWDRTLVKQTALLSGHLQEVSCVAISSDGRQVLSATAIGDNEVWLWDVSQQRVRHRLSGHTSKVIALSFMPGNDKALSFDGKVAAAWDLTSGKPAGTIEISKFPISQGTFSADGKRGLFANSSALQLWDLEKNRVLGSLQLGIGETLLDMALSADGKLALLLAGQSLIAYDLSAGKQIAKFTVPVNSSRLALSPDARYAVTAHLHEAILWGLPSVGP